MGLETFEYIDDLDEANPLVGNQDPLIESDDHHRGIKATLKNTFAGSATETVVKVAKDARLTITGAVMSFVATAAATLRLTDSAGQEAVLQKELDGDLVLANGEEGGLVKVQGALPAGAGNVVMLTLDPEDTYLFNATPGNCKVELRAGNASEGYLQKNAGDTAFQMVNDEDAGVLRFRMRDASGPPGALWTVLEMNASSNEQFLRGPLNVALAPTGGNPRILLAGATLWEAGTGSPEGVLAAPVGSLYSRTDGGAGTSLYVKESGAGNTGWAAK